MDFQIDRARAMMIAGSPLASALRGRIGFELRLIVASGLRVLDKLQHARGDIFRRRPVITKRDGPGILFRALLLQAS
jgi:phytoene synthase